MRQQFIDFHNVEAEKTALLVHGLVSDSQSSWIRLVSYLENKGYNTLSVDLTGHGMSDRRRNYSFAEWILEVSDLFNDYPTPDVTIGHSLGGLVAAGVNRIAPAEKLLLIDPLMHAPAPLVEWVQKRIILNQANAPEAVLRRRHPDWTEEQLRRSKNAMESWDRNTINALDSESGTRIVNRFLNDPDRGEVWLARPKNASILSDAAVKMIKDRGVKVLTSPSGGHSLHLDQPAFIENALDMMNI